MLSLMKEFVEQNGRMPKTKEEYKGHKLGAWYTTQRRLAAEGNLRTDRLEMLNDLGYDLSIRDNVSTWQYKYDLLQEFYEMHKRFPYSTEVYKGVKLGMWLCQQKHLSQNRAAYPECRRTKIEALGVLNVNQGELRG